MADEVRRGREGSRWINERPSGEDLAAWFEANVDMPDGLEHKNYVQGITMIPQKEKAKQVVGFTEQNVPVIQEVENLVYIPYAKVETRVKFFYDYMAENDDWFGVIEPVEIEGGKAKGFPPGYFALTVEQTKSGYKPLKFFCCSMRVRIYEKDTVEEEKIQFLGGREQSVEFRRRGKMILDAPPATKMVPALNRYGEADNFALMKAETGAIGRALGLAGMLVIPGSGVASAEDMQEAGQGDQVVAPPPETAPAPQQTEMSQEQATTDLRREVAAGIATLREHHPEEYKEFTDWARQRGIAGIEELDMTKLRGLDTKVKKHLAAAAEGAEEEIGPDADRESAPGPEAEVAD